jgi:opacity protein-like surface antigen
MERNVSRSLTLVMLAVFIGAPALSLAAEGFYMGAGFGMSQSQESGDLINDFDPDSGTALEMIHLGYNFSDRWGIGLQWGVAFGTADEIERGDTVDPLGDIYNLMIGRTFDWSEWGQSYVSLGGRYSYDTGGDFVPYFDAGFGYYEMSVTEMTNILFFLPVPSDEKFEFDPTIGIRFALGAQYYFNKKWYVTPEVSYHLVEYSEVEYTNEKDMDTSVDVDTRADMILFLLKIGRHWKGGEEATPSIFY